MAKLLNGIWGAITGKLGNLVAVTRRGVTYLRALPKPSSKRPTEKQIAHRARFKFMSQFFIPFTPYLTAGFYDPNSQRTAVNAAFALNYSRVIMGSYPNFVIDYGALIISDGVLKNLYEAKWITRGASGLDLLWTYPAPDYSNPDDQVMLVVYDPLLKIADGFIGGVSRCAGRSSFELHPRMVNHALEVYVAVAALNRRDVSRSLYLGRITR